MKKRYYFYPLFVVILFACSLMFATEAYAFKLNLGSIGGKLFGSVLMFIGFSGSGGSVCANGSCVNAGFCWFCPMIAVVFDTINTLATGIASELKSVLVATLGVGILFFIAFRVGATVIKLQEVDLMQFLGELFKHLGRAIIATALIYYSVAIFEYVITPLLSYSLNLSITFMNSYSLDASGVGNTLTRAAVSNFTDSSESICNSLLPRASTAVSETRVFSEDLKISLQCMVATVSANMILGIVIGLVVIGMGMLANVVWPDVQMVLSGGIILWSFFIIFLKVPFVLIDNLIRLAFVAALMPFWIILWVFPATVQYTKAAWNMFVASCVSFISFGVVVAIIMTLVAEMCPDTKGILEMMIPGYDLIASAKASMFTKNTLLTLALGSFCKNMLNAPDEFAARISQSYGIGVGQGMEQQVAQAAGRSLAAVGTLGAVGAGMTAVLSGKIDENKAKETADMFSGGKSILPEWLGLDSSRPASVGQYGGSSSRPAGQPGTPGVGQQTGTTPQPSTPGMSGLSGSTPTGTSTQTGTPGVGQQTGTTPQPSTPGMSGLGGSTPTGTSTQTGTPGGTPSPSGSPSPSPSGTK